MSAPPVETIATDAAATSLPNAETVNKAGIDQSAPTDQAAAATDAKLEEIKATNGSAEVTEAESTDKVEEKTVEKTEGNPAEEKIEKSENNGHKRTPYKKEFERDNNQPRRTHFNSYPKGPNHSKYDPSVLESTTDQKQIRAQVCAIIV